MGGFPAAELQPSRLHAPPPKAVYTYIVAVKSVAAAGVRDHSTKTDLVLNIPLLTAVTATALCLTRVVVLVLLVILGEDNYSKYKSIC